MSPIRVIVSHPRGPERLDLRRLLGASHCHLIPHFFHLDLLLFVAFLDDENPDDVKKEAIIRNGSFYFTAKIVGLVLPFIPYQK